MKPPKRRFAVKTLQDGRAFLNLGCGARTNASWNNVDFGPYAYFAHYPRLARLLRRLRILSGERYQALLGVDRDIVAWDLRRGVPYDDESFDAVYSCNFIVLIDRPALPELLSECWRVLKPGGLIRLVIPDLLLQIQRIVSTAAAVRLNGPAALRDHERAIEDVFELFVRRVSVGTQRQRSWVQWLERLIRGSPEKRSECSRWVYDEYTLSAVLSTAGFSQLTAHTATTSAIRGWSGMNLDVNPDGDIWVKLGLFLEGVKRASPVEASCLRP